MGNKTSEDTLFKSRSSSASIKAGYRLYTGSFRKIFKSSWLAALIYAFFFSALGTISVIQVPRLSLQILSDMDNPSGYIDRYIWLTSAIIVLLIVGTIAEVLFYSCGLSLLRQHQKQSSILFPAKWFSFDRHTSLRTLKAALCNIPIALVAAAVVAVAAYCTPRMTFLGAHSHTVAMVFTGLLSVAVAFLLMPLCFVSMKYVNARRYAFHGAVENRLHRRVPSSRLPFRNYSGVLYCHRRCRICHSVAVKYSHYGQFAGKYRSCLRRSARHARQYCRHYGRHFPACRFLGSIHPYVGIVPDVLSLRCDRDAGE